MKLSEHLTFAILLIPTIVVVAAAVLSLSSPEPAPEDHPIFQIPSSTGLYPADMTADE